MPRRSANLEMMVRAASKAARGLLRDFGEVEQLQVSRKGPGDFVSAADRQAEQVIKEELTKARPDYGFLMEESGEVIGKSKHNRWIVDPLDGTTNFLHGLPHWSISIALEQHGKVTAALIYDPLRNEMFTADMGNGAFVNDRRIRVSARKDMDTALLGCGLPIRNWPGRQKGFTSQMEKMADISGGLRRLGAASLDLAYVAAGRQDGYWEYGVRPWDIAAGILIVKEANGKVDMLEGGDDMLKQGTFMASNGGIHATFKSKLIEATPHLN